jgi:hypothetical protein
MDLPQVLCGALYKGFGIFGTGTSPGMLIKVELSTMKKVSTMTFIDGEDRPACIITFGK